jgi:O-antigen/teichoic acid export membrane protein
MMAAGFISFPILTRIFSLEEYGKMSLIATTLLIGTAIGKAGLPESIVRFYSECKHKGQTGQFHYTVLSTSVAVALVTALLILGGVELLGESIGDNDLVRLLVLSAALLVTGSVTAVITSFLRAEQRTRLYNIIAVLQRYASLAVSLFLMFYVVKGLYGFYIGQVLSGVIILLLLFYVYWRSIRVDRGSFSREIAKSIAVFGFPLIWAEFGHLSLNYIDRYLIQFYMGPASVGVYTAGYNLSTYVTETLIYPINYALTPLYMGILVNEGEQRTKEFLTKTFTYFTLVLCGAAVGFIAVGKDVTILLASDKYADSYGIVPYVVLGQAIYACTLILNNGLFIKKKTHVFNNVMLVSCLVNFGSNIIFIPKYGIIGAAISTLLSNGFYAIVITYYSFREFSFPIDYRRIGLFVCASLVMFTIIRQINVGHGAVNLLCQIVTGAVLYAAIIVFLDRRIRVNVMNVARQVLR